jgi:hypothetical protein
MTAIPFDGGQLAVDFCKAVIVLGRGAFCDQYKARAPLAGLSVLFLPCSDSTSCMIASLASARSVSGSP